MRALVLADLHYDFWAEAKRDPFAGIEAEMAELDLLILAGDITNKPKIRWKQAFARLAEMVDPAKTHVFPGNHDFYQWRLDAEDRLADFAAEAGVHYANSKAIVAGQTRFLCATLWTDLELGPGRLVNETRIPARMNDYKHIRLAASGFGPARPHHFVALHRQHKAWLEMRLVTPFDGQTVVVTHHAPHPGVLADYADGLDAAYASDLEEMILAHNPAEWLFGHCHDAKPLTVGTTDLANVSLGYPDDVADPAARIASLIREW